MDKNQILTSQAALIRMEAIEKRLGGVEERMDGLIKRLKRVPSEPVKRWVPAVCAAVGLVAGLLLGLVF